MEPDPDQILGGYIFMDMWQGKIPHLGGAGASKFSIAFFRIMKYNPLLPPASKR